MTRFLSLFVAVLGVAAVVGLVTRLRKVEPAPPPLVEPARAPFADNIGARGIIESVNENVRIAPAVSGLVTKVLVKVGDVVGEGAVLIEQDSRDARALIEIEEAQIETLRAQIAEAEVTLADKRDQWTRIEKLSQEKVASIDERQRVKFANDAATSAIERARKQLAAAEKQAQRTRVQLDLLTVKAPRRGTVLQVNIRAGEYASITSPEPLILLGQVDQFQLRADVDEDNAARVREGCRAIAYIKGTAKDPIPLTFVRIEPYILPKRSLTGESSERVDTRVLQVIFRFDRPTTPVYVGQQMDVFLDAGETGAKGEAPTEKR
jgi:multidrug efflux pump subunit AcrA (membrane-fusion protein)